MLTQERLREVLDYDPDTGVFTWRVRTNSRVEAGDVAGNLRKDGYVYIGIDGRRHLAHRLAWLYAAGGFPTGQIDHANGNRADNRIANLRVATNAENMQNQRKPRSDNTTGHLGVTRYRGKFQAQLQVNGKQMFLGYFTTPEAAHAAYLEAKRRLHPFGTL